MPVRSLTSSVFKWPDAGTVEAAVRRWAAKVAREHPEVVKIGYFGSYARGDWGVGSDVDLIIIVRESDKPFELRGSDWDTMEIPVPTDVLVYTGEEWQKLFGQNRSMVRLGEEIIWLDLLDNKRLSKQDSSLTR